MNTCFECGLEPLECQCPTLQWDENKPRVLTVKEKAILDKILGKQHTGWFRKGERYQMKDHVYEVLFDTPKNNMVVSVRIFSATGTVLDKGSSKRGVMAKDIRDKTPIK